MARLRIIVVAQETDGDVYALATCKFYEPGTATASGSSTSGTPFAGNLYAAISGGSPISTTQTLGSNGTLAVWTTSKSRVDVGIEPAGGGTAFVRQYETPELDPADVLSLLDSQVLIPDGTESAPGLAWASDTNNGLRRVGADYTALVAGGVDAIRISGAAADAPFGPRVGFGNVDEPGATDNPENLVHVHYSGSANSNGVIGFESQITDNASAVRSGGTIPDSSGVTTVVAQTAASAAGAMRALEAHTVRAHASAGADANATALGMELGIHTGAAGNASFTGTGSAFPKNIGAWISSYQDSIMSGLGVAAVRADCAVYINGTAGFKSGIRYVDTDGSTVLLDLTQQGLLLLNNVGNAAAPQVSFWNDPDTGMFWGGTNVLAFSTGGTESGRFDASGNLGVGGTATAGSRIYATGGLIEAAGGFKNGGKEIAAVSSPAQITSDQNDYSAGSTLATARIVQVSSDASRTITGISASQVTGQRLLFVNTGAQNIVLAHENAGSTATNRINTHTSANFTLNAAEGIELYYTGSRWRTIGAP